MLADHIGADISFDEHASTRRLFAAVPAHSRPGDNLDLGVWAKVLAKAVHAEFDSHVSMPAVHCVLQIDWGYILAPS